MSAAQRGELVDQLAWHLRPHKVVVHHDYRKLADFRPTGANIELIPNPLDTGWGTWGFCDAIFHTLRYALEQYDFDYFQLLSPTCMPLRPIQEFEAFVATDQADVHADQMLVTRDDDTLMSFGYRTFARFPSLRFKILRRLRSWYFSQGTDVIQTHSLAMLRLRDADRSRTLPARSALWLTRQAALGRLGGHPFGAGLQPMIGGTFFGARRAVCEYLVELHARTAIPQYLKHLSLVDETLFATLIGNSNFLIGPSNHAINDFNKVGHPKWIELVDLERLAATGRFFGRKFSEDPYSPIRQVLLDRLGNRWPTV